MKKSIAIILISLASFCLLPSSFAQYSCINSSTVRNGYLLTEWLVTYWKGNEWENAWKYSYTYDGNKNLIATIEQDWVDNTWVNQFNYLYTYDGNNRVVETLYRKWEEENWLNDDKQTLAYDAYGNILCESKYTWLSSLSDWLLILQKDYQFDAAQNLTEWKIMAYSGGSMIDRYKMIYHYDVSNNMIESIYTISNDGIIWENNGRYLGQYDQNNNLIESLSQNWTDSAWADEFKMTYGYDANNRQIRETIEYFDSSAWVNINQYLYAYDDSGNKTEHIKQNGGGSAWVNYERYTYEFTGSNDLLVKTYYLWDGAAWEYFNIEENKYDEHENMVQTLFRDWVSGTWSDKRLDHFSYFNLTGVVWVHDNNPIVFPNPTSGRIEIRMPKPAQSCTLNVYDLSGRFIREATILGTGEADISGLTPAVYIIRINTSQHDYLQKIIKQ